MIIAPSRQRACAQVKYIRLGSPRFQALLKVGFRLFPIPLHKEGTRQFQLSEPAHTVSRLDHLAQGFHGLPREVAEVLPYALDQVSFCEFRIGVDGFRQDCARPRSSLLCPLMQPPPGR